MLDDNHNLIEWYFDISKKIGLENGIPFEDDLYLDMIITPNGEKIIIDEDELLEAREKEIIIQEDVDSAYKTLKEIENKYAKNIDELIELTNYILSIFKINKIGDKKVNGKIKLIPYTDDDYEFVYNVKKNAYKNM